MQGALVDGVCAHGVLVLELSTQGSCVDSVGHGNQECGSPQGTLVALPDLHGDDVAGSRSTLQGWDVLLIWHGTVVTGLS